VKTHITLLKRSFQVFSVLISIVCIPCVTFGIEPIGTIGQPFPEQHAFVNNQTIVRVVPTHIQIIDTNAGEVVDEFGKRTHYSNVKLSPTAEHLAMLNRNINSKTTTVGIWDVNRRQLISQWEIAGYIYDHDTAFCPTQPIFATAIASEVHLWNWQNGATIGILKRENMPGDRTIVFSADGCRLMVATRSHVELWNIETLQLEGRFDGYTGDWIKDVVISPDGSVIAIFEGNSNTIYVSDVRTQRLLWKDTSGIGHISSVTFSPDGQFLYVATKTSWLSRTYISPWEGWDDQVRVWDVKSGQQIDEFSSEFRRIEKITLSPNGKIALLHYQDAVVLWDIETKQSLNVWADFVIDDWGLEVELSPDGKTMVQRSSDLLKIWDIRSQQMRLLVSAENELFVNFAIAPDGHKIAVCRNPWIELRDLRTGKVETQFPHFVGEAEAIAFSPSGRWLAIGDDFEYVFVFDLKNSEKIQKLKPNNKSDIMSIYYRVAFSENDEYLAAAGDGRNDHYQVLLWKREGDTFVFQYAWQMPKLYSKSSSSLAFASAIDGSTVLAVSTRKELQIWKLLPNAPLLLKTFAANAPALFTPDGRYLFTNQNDNLQILDWQVDLPLEHPPIPEYFAFSAEGYVLLSYDKAGQIQVWDATKLLPSQLEEPTAVETRGKKFVTLGQIKRNQLLQNFPNPFNPETWIPFRLADKSNVTIRIYTPTGKLVRSISPGTMSAGDYSSQSQAIHWDGRNDAGETVSSGVYLYTINAGDFSATRKMLIRK
jgi:WD40 repeat protein